MKKVEARTALATTSWTLVGPNPGKYYLVAPHPQRTVLKIVFLVCLRVVALRATGHHISIQEVDHEKQQVVNLQDCFCHEKQQIVNWQDCCCHEKQKLSIFKIIENSKLYIGKIVSVTKISKL